MTSATLHLHHFSNHKPLHEITVQSRHGIHVGRFDEFDYGEECSFNPHLTGETLLIRSVTIWHPVPRWMTPREALTAFAA